jgi:hypothetical protein
MTTARWQVLLGGLFAVMLVFSVLSLVFSSGNSTALAGIAALMFGGLLLTPMLPKIREITIGATSIGAKLNQLEATIDDTKEQVKTQQETINNLVRYSMSASIFRHLAGIALLKTYTYYNSDSDRREMYFLRDNGFIKPRGSSFLDFDSSLHGRNLVDVAEPTPIGSDCVRLRIDEIPRQWLEDKNNIRIDPSTL